MDPKKPDVLNYYPKKKEKKSPTNKFPSPYIANEE